MDKPIKNILCYSQYDFNSIMRENQWIDNLPNGISCISICSLNEDNYASHWFNNSDNVFNLDIDSVGIPELTMDNYLIALDLYLNNQIDESNNYFNHIYIDNEGSSHNVHILNYEEAFNLVNWIDKRIKEDHTIYIHCARGGGRSQGVVKYILDAYKNDYDIKLNDDNLNNRKDRTCNLHVVRMLKQAYKTLKNN